ncbi:TIGR02302 family protein [Pseudooceanicola sp. CBS1P-1]|uniref:TIGR02302 family protein n=1 Tax=Pseudooceanicola albus TaxID=2692189 RepID=A0A6L7G2M4_9RHOB|nr:MULTISPECIES: TIGR02302 family protein [Pseudooceanicola]MBT9384827.1 TIGR02302 family protein [Pseudooceanicola endophyticus]MXN18179.1 TIGR02302 family protein [Pseudooceanicola albus]
MAENSDFDEILRRLKWPLRLTRVGLLAERFMRAFWPLWALCATVLALLMLGIQDSSNIVLVWSVGAGSFLAIVWFLIRGALRFRFPRREEALKRLDATLKGHPLQALGDDMASGGDDPGTRALWAAHRARMAARTRGAKAVRPDLNLTTRDPFGLRYVALLCLMTALLFGSFWRIGSVADMAPGGAAEAAAGPSWEGWVAPPPHTRLPVLYLPDIPAGTLQAPQGSKVTLRLYGPEGKLHVAEDVSGRVGDLPPSDANAQEFSVHQGGRIAIDGPGGRVWKVALIPDQKPKVEATGAAEASVEGQLSLPFHASDDYGVESGQARIVLDLPKVDRRYGLALDPEPRAAITVPLPMPISGSRADFNETLIENFSQHPWANMPVKVSLSVTDSAGQESTGPDYETVLVARRFFDPLAASLIEMRRDLLWNRANAPRISEVLKAITWNDGGAIRSDEMKGRIRDIAGSLEHKASLSDEIVDDTAKSLWDLAIQLEDGDLDDAKERMNRAQERLEEAMRNGASDQEIAKLMQELRDATQDYMRQLAQQAARQSEQNPNQPPMDMQNALQMNQDDLQKMMDRIQELMQQGRMAEAQEALRELQKLMENMQVTQGQGGQGQQSPGQQAMDGLGETLRNQQGLSDDAFRSLQDQFNPGQGGQGQPGQRPGDQPGQPGQGGQQGGNQMGDGSGSGQGSQGQQGQGSDADALAQRQQALRDELQRQRGNLPGAGTEAGRAARDSLDRADRAMREAEGALREGDLAQAIDNQATAMEALREGMRSLGEAMAEAERQMQGQQGQAQGNDGGKQNDPLGRNAGSNGMLGNDREMLNGELDNDQRARDLLDEIRRRSAQNDRSEEERDYLNRLLDRF